MFTQSNRLAKIFKYCLLPKMNRRAFLKAAVGATAFAVDAPALLARAAEPSDQEILSDCTNRIEKHRKTSVSISLRDSSGRPLRNTPFTLEQQRHQFRFGCNLFQLGRCSNPEQEELYRRQFAALFNYCTLPFYWASYETERGHPDYERTDQALAWTSTAGIDCKGHPLVWDHPAGSPAWLPDDPAQIASLVIERVRDIVGRFQQRMEIWDVVNEATHLPDKANSTTMAHWGAGIGPVRYTSAPLMMARKTNPRALLLVNDYRTDDAYYNLLDECRSTYTHAPLYGAIGIQSHMHDSIWPLHKVWSVCDRFSRLGRPLHFTETTILSGKRTTPGEHWGPTNPQDEERQAELTANFYTAVFAHPALEALTWWDFTDYHAWQGAPAGWLRNDMSPKPVYSRLQQLIKGQWWTNLQDRTNPRGHFSTRAFYGQHKLTVNRPGAPPFSQTLNLTPGRKHHFEIIANP